MGEYIDARGVMDELAVGRTTAYRLIDSVRAHEGRYGTYAVVKYGGIVRVSSKALIDWMRYGDAIEAGMDVPGYEDAG
ncbi:MAG: hypothetical protein ACI4W2_04760 [Eubacterium sp.]